MTIIRRRYIQCNNDVLHSYLSYVNFCSKVHRVLLQVSESLTSLIVVTKQLPYSVKKHFSLSRAERSQKEDTQCIAFKENVDGLSRNQQKLYTTIGNGNTVFRAVKLFFGQWVMVKTQIKRFSCLNAIRNRRFTYKFSLILFRVFFNKPQNPLLLVFFCYSDTNFSDANEMKFTKTWKIIKN